LSGALAGSSGRAGTSSGTGEPAEALVGKRRVVRRDHPGAIGRHAVATMRPTGNPARLRNARHCKNAWDTFSSPVGKNVLLATTRDRLCSATTQPDQSTPVLTEQRDVAQPPRVEKARHPVDVALNV
jgi:hypothetical protein